MSPLFNSPLDHYLNPVFAKKMTDFYSAVDQIQEEKSSYFKANADLKKMITYTLLPDRPIGITVKLDDGIPAEIADKIWDSFNVIVLSGQK